MDHNEQYRKGVRRILEEIDTDADTAMAMILLTATLMDLCTWDSEVVDIVISDCKRGSHVDLRKPEPGA